jgi:hypothetical protein
MMYLVFATDILLNLQCRTDGLCMSESDMEMVSYPTRCIAKAIAESPHWQIIDHY